MYRYIVISREVVRKSARNNPVLWVVLSSMFFKEIWKNGTRGYGLMFVSAKRKQQK